VKQIWERDPDPLPDDWTKQGRQFAVMNLEGRVCGVHRAQGYGMGRHKSGKYATAQGNILAGPRRREQHDRRVRADGPAICRSGSSRRSRAGQAGGGDKRGQQSAGPLRDS